MQATGNEHLVTCRASTNDGGESVSECPGAANAQRLAATGTCPLCCTLVANVVWRLEKEIIRERAAGAKSANRN